MIRKCSKIREMSGLGLVISSHKPVHFYIFEKKGHTAIALEYTWSISGGRSGNLDAFSGSGTETGTERARFAAAPAGESAEEDGGTWLSAILTAGVAVKRPAT